MLRIQIEEVVSCRFASVTFCLIRTPSGTSSSWRRMCIALWAVPFECSVSSRMHGISRMGVCGFIRDNWLRAMVVVPVYCCIIPVRACNGSRISASSGHAPWSETEFPGPPGTMIVALWEDEKDEELVGPTSKRTRALFAHSGQNQQLNLLLISCASQSLIPQNLKRSPAPHLLLKQSLSLHNISSGGCWVGVQEQLFLRQVLHNWELWDRCCWILSWTPRAAAACSRTDGDGSRHSVWDGCGGVDIWICAPLFSSGEVEDEVPGRKDSSFETGGRSCWPLRRSSVRLLVGKDWKAS